MKTLDVIETLMEEGQFEVSDEDLVEIVKIAVDCVEDIKYLRKMRDVITSAVDLPKGGNNEYF